MSISDTTAEYDVMSVGQWAITLVLLSIPLVNVVLLFVWGFGDGTHPSKRNFARAALLIYAIMFGIALLFALFAISVGVGTGVFT